MKGSRLKAQRMLLAFLAIGLLTASDIGSWGRGGSPKFKGGAVVLPTVFNDTLDVLGRTTLKDSLSLWNGDSLVFSATKAGRVLARTPTALGASTAMGLFLDNRAASTSGVTAQVSPSLRFRGTAWKSAATAQSRTFDWQIWNQPVAGSSAITSNLLFQGSNNGAAYTTPMTLTSDGALTTTGAITSGGDVNAEGSSGTFRSAGTSDTRVRAGGATNNDLYLFASSGGAGSGRIRVAALAAAGWTGNRSSGLLEVTTYYNQGGAQTGVDFQINRSDSGAGLGFGSDIQRLIRCLVNGAAQFVVNRHGVYASTCESQTFGPGVITFAVISNTMRLTGDGGGNTIGTITGGENGQTLTLIFLNDKITITDDATEAANSVNLSAAFTSVDGTVLQLVFDGTSWREVSRSVNG
ncbi:MAG: hypothetical protein FJY67_01850 [Calditrichaeota bacterium]|nr:hypothetical protein [Calditrichota bacterium]